MIRNTTKEVQDCPLGMLGAAMGGRGMSGAIEEQEAQGQRELLRSEVIPSDGSSKPEEQAALEAMGFTLGEPVQGDAMFRKCTLPEGWKRVGSDHAMWSYIHDDKGRKRASVFYKAAFYDRSAHIGLECRYHSTTKYATGETLESVIADYDKHTHRIYCVCDADGTVLHSEPGCLRADHKAGDAAYRACSEWLKANYPDFASPAAYW